MEISLVDTRQEGKHPWEFDYGDILVSVMDSVPRRYGPMMVIYNGNAPRHRGIVSLSRPESTWEKSPGKFRKIGVLKIED